MKWKIKLIIDRIEVIGDGEYRCRLGYFGYSLLAELKVNLHMKNEFTVRVDQEGDNYLFMRYYSDSLISRCMIFGLMDWIESSSVIIRHLG